MERARAQIARLGRDCHPLGRLLAMRRHQGLHAAVSGRAEVQGGERGRCAVQGRARTKARATCTTWSQNCCGRSSMMPNESAREKTARREATVDRQKGFWMVGRADFFGADRWFLLGGVWAPRRKNCWLLQLCQCICRQGAEALEHDCGRFLLQLFELGVCRSVLEEKTPVGTRR